MIFPNNITNNKVSSSININFHNVKKIKILIAILFALTIGLGGTVCFAAPELVTPPAENTSTFIFNGKEQTYELEEKPELYTITNNKRTGVGQNTVKVSLINKELYMWADTEDTIDKEYDFEILEHVYLIDEPNHIIPDDIDWSSYNLMTVTENGELAGGNCEVDADIYGKVSGGHLKGWSTNIYSGEISGGVFESQMEIENAVISGGIFNNQVSTSSSSQIQNAIFNGSLLSDSIIFGGEFNGAVTSGQVIYGGTFNDFVQNMMLIAGGIFNGEVRNEYVIVDGIFNDSVTNTRNANIVGGTFKRQLLNYGTVGSYEDYVVKFKNCEINNMYSINRTPRILLPYEVDESSYVSTNFGDIQVAVTLNGRTQDNCYYGKNILETFNLKQCFKITNRILYVNEDDAFTLQPQKYISKLPSSSTPKYTIKFMRDDKNEINSVKVEKGKLLDEPDIPELEGYEFVDWYLDKDLKEKYDFDSKVTKSFKLYAKWKKNLDYCAKNEIILTINEKKAYVFGTKTENDVAPIIINDRTMIPARFIAENLGANVEWNSEERKVTISRDKTTILIYIDSDVAYINDQIITLDAPAIIQESRTYLPVRFITENLGANVEWDSELRRVTIKI